jgi:probable HAF family extracellular repeat protein
VYVVRKGDTLSGIAKRFAVTLRNILAANPQIKDPSLIHVGDAIKIPAAYLPTLGGSGTSPADINNRGQIVTGEDHILQDGVKTRLGTLGGRETAAMAINDLGQVVGYGTTESGDEHAFIWQDGVMTDLGTLGGRESSALAINDRGQVVGSSWINDRDQVFEDYTLKWGDSHAFIWQDGVMRDLGTLGGLDSHAYAINDLGQVVGISTTESELTSAFIWQDGVMTDLGPAAPHEGGCG